MGVEDVLLGIKTDIEQAVVTATYNGKVKKNGLEAKKLLICSSRIIQYIHEYIKELLIQHGVTPESIFPPLGETKPELKLTGLLKQKKQDIAIKPLHIPEKKEKISWGPLAYEHKWDTYGRELTEQMLTINIRSQLSSLGKNADTLFERTYAESSNLHELHKKMVLGEVFLIPTHEYCEESMKENRIAWKEKRVNLERYISFFSQISGRENEQDSGLKYERCALLIVDFKREIPKIYHTTEELKQDGLVSPDFDLDMRLLDIEHFVPDLLHVYQERFQALPQM